jgi:hypothetical protein
MKFRLHEIVLGALLTVAVFAMGMLFSPSHQPSPAGKYQSQQTERAAQDREASKPSAAEGAKAGQDHPQQDDKSEFWSAKLTDWLLAIFTFFLVTFTGGLWWSTSRLWIATKIAADAAQVAAEHIPIVEGAYVHALVEGNVIDKRLNSIGDDVSSPEIPLEITLSNFGKTPAFVNHVSARLSCPPIIDGETQRLFAPSETILGADRSHKDTLTLRPLSLAEARHVETQSAIIILQGTIYYADIWGNEWATDFDGRYEPNSKSFKIAHKPRIKTK